MREGSRPMTNPFYSTNRPLSRLRPRQERFVREYSRSGNAKRAATLAGYSVRSAKQVGCAMLKKPHIRRALETLRAGMAPPDEGRLTPQWAIRQLLEETTDPNPRIRLSAKRSILHALATLGPEAGQLECRNCAEARKRRKRLEELSRDELRLERVGESAQEIRRKPKLEFETWERNTRNRVEEAIMAAKRIRGDIPGYDPRPAKWPLHLKRT